jgi:hypothetical protein
MATTRDDASTCLGALSDLCEKSAETTVVGGELAALRCDLIAAARASRDGRVRVPTELVEAIAEHLEWSSQLAAAARHASRTAPSGTPVWPESVELKWLTGRRSRSAAISI